MSDFYQTRKSAGGASGLELDSQSLSAVNRYTMRDYAAAELFAFKVTVCDNEIDRDQEAFPMKSLQKLAELFKGKTVIMDHSRRAENQCARIYAAEVIRDGEKKTSYGDPYARLEARCYMPRGEETLPLIGSIEAGILKEVSVGCSTGRQVCSICGESYWSAACEHRTGLVYGDGKKCFVRLEDPKDAYEVSFVAVPAQPAAGVTKGMDQPGGETGFRAELEGLAGMIKEFGTAVRRIEKSTVRADPPPAADRSGTEAVRLIQEVNTLIKKVKGAM